MALMATDLQSLITQGANAMLTQPTTTGQLQCSIISLPTTESVQPMVAGARAMQSGRTVDFLEYFESRDRCIGITMLTFATALERAIDPWVTDTDLATLLQHCCPLGLSASGARLGMGPDPQLHLGGHPPSSEGNKVPGDLGLTLAFNSLPHFSLPPHCICPQTPLGLSPRLPFTLAPPASPPHYLRTQLPQELGPRLSFCLFS